MHSWSYLLWFPAIVHQPQHNRSRFSSFSLNLSPAFSVVVLLVLIILYTLGVLYCVVLIVTYAKKCCSVHERRLSLWEIANDCSLYVEKLQCCTAFASSACIPIDSVDSHWTSESLALSLDARRKRIKPGACQAKPGAIIRKSGLLIGKCKAKVRSPTQYWVLYGDRKMELYDWSIPSRSGPMSCRPRRFRCGACSVIQI